MELDDIEGNLDSYSIKKKSDKEVSLMKKKQSLLDEYTVPLLIHSVLHKTDGEENLSLGITFKYILLYGRTSLIKFVSKEKIEFNLDDGTGSIKVVFYRQEKLVSQLKDLRQLDVGRICKLPSELRCLDQVLNKITNDLKLIDSIRCLTDGCALFVRGTTMLKNNQLILRAHCLQVDSQAMRDAELFFKQHLLHCYSYSKHFL